MDHKTYLEYVQLLNHHAHLYYCLDTSEISDSEYDSMYREIVEFERRHPEWAAPNSPTQKVGRMVVGNLPQRKHLTKMYSLDNVFNIEELSDWLRMLGSESVDLILDPKFDGLAISVEFDDANRVAWAATRGNGEVGEDITHSFVVSHISELQYSHAQTVRGEMVMTLPVFQRVNTELVKSGKKPFVNPRNAIAGTMRQLDSSVTKARHPHFIPYEYYLDDTGYPQIHLGRGPIVTYDGTEESVSAIYSTIQEFGKQIKSLPYQTDGVVLKVHCALTRATLGYTNRAPRWAIAYKFPEEIVTTILLDVVDQVGRTGVITPKAIVEPVYVSGVTVSHATLHNFDEIARLGLKIGDTIELKRAGEVIPKIVGVAQHSSHGKEIIIPTSCPSCGSPLKRRSEEEVHLYCTQPAISCPDKMLRRIDYFCGRTGMDIDGLGEETISDLIKAGLIQTPADIYKLHLNPKALLVLPRSTEYTVSKLLKSIDASRTPELHKFITAIGIPGVADSTSRKLANRYLTMQALMQAQREDLEEVDDVGQITAIDIVDTLRFNDYAWVAGLLEEVKIRPVTVVTDGPFSGKMVAITGKFGEYSRDQIKDRVRALGGYVTGDVSARTSVLLAGDNPGGKVKKAEKLGVKVLGTDIVEFMMTHDDVSIGYF